MSLLQRGIEARPGRHLGIETTKKALSIIVSKRPKARHNRARARFKERAC